MRRDTYCPTCGEPVDRGLSEDLETAPCDHCGEDVEPISDAKEADMDFKAFHPIRCTKCETNVRLVGLHMGQYSDGVLAACKCTSLESLPYELGEPELPDRWKVLHTFEAFPEPEEDRPTTDAEARGWEEWAGKPLSSYGGKNDG